MKQYKLSYSLKNVDTGKVLRFVDYVETVKDAKSIIAFYKKNYKGSYTITAKLYRVMYEQIKI